MKQKSKVPTLAAAFFLTLLLTSTVFAKQGTGGSNIPVADSEAPATNPVMYQITSEDYQNNESSADKPLYPIEQSDTDTIETTETEPPNETPEAQIPTEETPCFQRENLADRISCRLNKTQDELRNEPYDPEGCKTRSDEWQTNCRQTYQKIYPCYDKPVGKERISCIKSELGLSQNLLPASKKCGDDETCKETYTNQIINLVAARLYDAEERVEDWYAENRLDQEVVQNFLVFITEAKWDLYNSLTTGERIRIIRRVQTEWNLLTEQVT